MRHLRARVLGAFEIEGVPATELGSRKARTLLKLLVLARGQPVPVDRLVDACWGDTPPSRPADQVAVLVSRLRGVLGRDRLARPPAGYTLVVDWLDVTAAGELADEAGRRLAAGAPAAARTAAAAALALVRGPLLDDEPDAPWAEVDRQAAARLTARLRHIGAETSLATGDFTDAADLAEALLVQDPYDEHALRLVMAARAAAGRPASALARYAHTRRQVADDLGVDLAPETEAVHTAILRGEPAPGLAVATATRPAGGAGVGSRLPGRDDALLALDAALTRATTTRTEIVEVAGEAGIGKTAVLATWAGRAQADGVIVLQGACRELERSLPLQAVLDALDAHLQHIGREAADAVLGPDHVTLAPLLPSTPASDTGAVPDLSEGAIGPARLFAALGAVLDRVAADGPTAILLDDVHLAGVATVDWLRHVRLRRTGPPLLLVAARRAEETVALPSTECVSLGPLDLAAATSVVGADRAEALHRRSGGNPLFLVELAAADPDDELPRSIRDAVNLRAERAGAAEATLRTAAILGASVDLDLLGAVTQLPSVEVLDHVEEGVRRRLLLERGGDVVFAHDLVRSALAAGAPATRVAFVHREAARALAGRPDSDPLAAAYHARLGGDQETAAAALARAATLAAARFDHETAESLLDRSLALRDDTVVRLGRARVRALRSRYDDAVTDALDAMRDGAGAPALEVAAWASYWNRDLDGARDLADDGVRLATDAATRAGCLVLAGRTRHAVGDLAGAEDRLVEGVTLSEGPQVVVASVWLGTLRSHQSRTAEALDLLRAATRPGLATGNATAYLHALLFTAHALAIAGRPAAALGVLGEYAAQVERTQLLRFAGRSDCFGGWILRNLGADGAATDSNQAALEAGPDAIVEVPLAAHLDLAEGALVRGDLDASAAHLDAATAVVDACARRGLGMVFGWRQQLKLRSHRARLAFARDELDEAEAGAAAVATEAAALGVPRYEVPARLLVARSRARRGENVDLDAAGRLVERLADVIRLESWWLVGEAARDLAVDAWWARAEAHAAQLARQAGERADELDRVAATRLDAWRAAPRR